MLTKILMSLILFSSFFLVAMIDLHQKKLRARRPLPHREQPHACAAGDVEAEEGTRLVEWLYEAKRQSWVNDVEQMLEKRKGTA